MLWGGRFERKLNSKALKFSSSLSFDKELILEDIEGSKAHAEMLGRVKIISKEESKKIIQGLERIEKEWKNKKWIPDENKYEDIHSAIESRLYEIIGDNAGKLHTGRSRNDQIATDLKLWVRKAAFALTNLIKKLQLTLVNISSSHVETIIPGYTHLQRAQPISLAFHLLAYVEMFERDKERIEFIKKSISLSPLGSGALAGSTLPLDREFTTKKLGFESPTNNALDSVSDRDFILDMLHTCAVGMMHLSRLSEEIILWSTSEWNFIKLNDEFTTGSSLMPQKKNPDLAELIRGKTGRVYGNYISLAATMKALPLSYNRDLQEDKEPLFDSVETLASSLDIMDELLKTTKFNKGRFGEEIKKDFSLATDLADWLVLKGIPFREAHDIIGKIVKQLEENNESFNDLTLEKLKFYNRIFDKSALDCLNIKSTLDRKKTFGSPNPERVKERINYWEKQLM